MPDEHPEDVLAAVLVPDFDQLAQRVANGDLAVFGWEWSEEGPETFEELFEYAAEKVGFVAAFERIAAKRVTIASREGAPPATERVRQAIAALEKHRDHQ
jgi:hypothetical protein